jgi:hypothetical protein
MTTYFLSRIRYCIKFQKADGTSAHCPVVETLLLSEDLKSIKERLQALSRFAQESASLRAQLSASDRAVREETSSKTDYLMHLPDEFYSGQSINSEKREFII